MRMLLTDMLTLQKRLTMIRDIFPLKIYETTFNEFDNIKEDVVKEILPFFETGSTKVMQGGGITVNEHGTYDGVPKVYTTANSFRDLHKRANITPLLNFLNKHIQEYWLQQGYHPQLKPYILQMWSNITPPGGNGDSHAHNPNPIAGVFYINATPEMGNLCIENPLEAVLGRMPWASLGDMNCKSLDLEIPVESGKLVMFPGWIRHKTLINVSKEDRLIISFNVACAGPNIYFNEIY